MPGRHGAAVADQADDDGAVDHRLQFLELQDVEQEAGEEGAGAEGDDGEVDEDPQAEGEAVVHVGLVQAFDQAQAGAIDAEEEQGTQGASHSRKRGVEQRGTPRVMNSAGYPREVLLWRRGRGARADSRTQSLLGAVVDLGLGAERFQHAEAFRAGRWAAHFGGRVVEIAEVDGAVGQASTQAGT
jgi:hypothetical protein